MPLFLLNNWKFIIPILALIVFGGYFYKLGGDNVQKQWDLSITRAVSSARETEQKDQLNGKIIGEKYESGIKAIDNSFNNALVGVYAKTSSDMPGKTNPSGKPDGAADCDKVHRVNRLIKQREAEKNTEKLIRLQEWENE